MTHPVYTLSFWKAYIVHMRPYLLFISGIAGAAGLAMNADITTEKWKIIVAFIPFFLGYGFGQALTDCFQTDTDKLSAPYRPLSKGIISIRSVLIVSICGLLACGVLLLLLNPVSFGLSLAAVFGLATYSYIKKHIWFGGPFYNAWIVALLPVMGYYACLSGFQKPEHSLFPLIAISFFSYANFVLIGYLKDIEADRATNYKTFPVVFGWDKTVMAGDVIALAAILIFWLQEQKNNWEIVLGIAATIIMVSGQVVAHLSKKKNEVGALIPIVATVRGFILIHIAVILHFHPAWLSACILYYVAFEWVLYQRPSKYQV